MFIRALLNYEFQSKTGVAAHFGECRERQHSSQGLVRFVELLCETSAKRNYFFLSNFSFYAFFYITLRWHNCINERQSTTGLWQWRLTTCDALSSMACIFAILTMGNLRWGWMLFIFRFTFLGLQVLFAISETTPQRMF